MKSEEGRGRKREEKEEKEEEGGRGSWRGREETTLP
jgi:hypothetical protein